MTHVEFNPGHERASTPDELVDLQLENLQQQLDQLRERLTSPTAFAELGDKSLLRGLVKEILRSRRRREKIFGGELFGEPAWDMLLELYGAELAQQKLSVSAACYASAVPHTTALRWVGKLEHDGWIRRMNDPFDGRRSWLLLTDQGSDRMREFLSGLAIRPVRTGPNSPLG